MDTNIYITNFVNLTNYYFEVTTNPVPVIIAQDWDRTQAMFFIGFNYGLPCASAWGVYMVVSAVMKRNRGTYRE